MWSGTMGQTGRNMIAAETPRREEKSELLSSVLSAPSARQPDPKRDGRRPRTCCFLVFLSASRRLGGRKNLTLSPHPRCNSSSRERIG